MSKTTPMSDPLYKKIEVVGTSEISIEAAVNNAVAQSNQTLRNIRWFEVGEIRGSIEDGQVDQWQVGLKLAFHVDLKESSGVHPKGSENNDAPERPVSPPTETTT